MIKKLLLLTTCFAACLCFALTDKDKAELISKNLLPNPGGEKYTAGWAESAGTFVHTTTAAQVASGNGALSWDAAASGNTLETSALTIPSGSYGNVGVAYCYFKGASAVTHEIQVSDGTNVLAETAITSSTSKFTKSAVYFSFPTSGTIELQIEAKADEAALYIDDCYLGLADGSGLSNLSQASLYGSISYTGATNCSWAVTSSSFSSFAADTDCSTPTVTGNASAPGTKIPAISFSTLPKGTYFIIATGAFNKGAGADYEALFRFSDGTNSTQGQRLYVDGSQSVTVPVISGLLTVSSAISSATINIQAMYISTSAAVNIINNNTNGSLKISVYKIPDAAQSAFNFDTSAASWSGYHASTCSWTTTSSSYADPSDDATCSLAERSNVNFGTVAASGSVSPGITFTPGRVQTYEVCARTVGSSSTTATVGVQLLDGSNTEISEEVATPGAASDSAEISVCGFYTPSSVASTTFKLRFKTSSGTVTIGDANSPAIEWMIRVISQQFPAPVINNSITSNGDGPYRMEVAEINCDASSSVTQQTGTWISAIGNRSTTSCAITIASGIFSSEPIACGATVEAATVQATSIAKASATSITVYGPSADYDANIWCLGPK